MALPATVQPCGSNASGGYGRISINGMTGNMQVTAQYTDFIRPGDAMYPAIDVSLNVTGHSTSITIALLLPAEVFRCMQEER